MLEELDTLLLVCTRLEKSNIPYMLTGSFAANFYAVPRMTRDIDIVLEIQHSDVNKLYQVFQRDFYLSESSITEAIEHESMFNIIGYESVYKIDFIVRKNKPYREIEFQRRRKIPIKNTSIWIVSPEDLIISKLSWAKDSFSEIQIRDVCNIFQNQKHLDKDYIERWVNHLELKEVYEKVLANA